MITNHEITEVLKQVIHPETGVNLVDGEMIESLEVDKSKIKFVLSLKRVRDPFALKIKRNAIAAIESFAPQYKDNIDVTIKEPAPKKQERETVKPSGNSIKKVIAISSCKGGVGKSTISAALAMTLAQMGHSVGIIDADIYGPSIPKMFGVESYIPLAKEGSNHERILPAQRYGVKIMSIGFFIKPNDALVWRGPMATNALKQLLHQTEWGDLDFLLIDLPPGTGDVHLSIISEIKIDGAIIVSTPQQIALADVVRGIEMFRNDKVNIKILGLVENMAWFTPQELPNNKYYIFGKDGCLELAKKLSLPLLAQIPISQSICDNQKDGEIDIVNNPVSFKYFHDMATKMISLL